METNHAKYHLRYLEKHGLLSSRREEGYWRFFGRVDLTETFFFHAPVPRGTTNTSPLCSTTVRSSCRRISNRSAR